jgi:hypothetical protein
VECVEVVGSSANNNCRSWVSFIPKKERRFQNTKFLVNIKKNLEVVVHLQIIASYSFAGIYVYPVIYPSNEPSLAMAITGISFSNGKINFNDDLNC